MVFQRVLIVASVGIPANSNNLLPHHRLGEHLRGLEEASRAPPPKKPSRADGSSKKSSNKDKASRGSDAAPAASSKGGNGSSKAASKGEGGEAGKMNKGKTGASKVWQAFWCNEKLCTETSPWLTNTTMTVVSSACTVQRVSYMLSDV